jgi:hypothetical protein
MCFVNRTDSDVFPYYNKEWIGASMLPCARDRVAAFQNSACRIRRRPCRKKNLKLRNNSLHQGRMPWNSIDRTFMPV